MTTAQQQSEISGLNADLAKSEKIVNATVNADGVANAVSVWTQTLNSDYKAGESLTSQQATAIQQLQALESQVQGKITSDPTLPTSQKNADTSQLATDFANAQAAVKAATNADGVNSAVATWTNTLNGDYQTGVPLTNQQLTANNSLSALAGQVQVKIMADTGLTGAQQQAQVAQLNADLAKGQSAVNAATSADGINAAVTSWDQTLNSDYHAGEALSDQQATASSNLQQLATQVQDKISADTGLTTAQQQSEISQLNTDLTQAQNAVKATTNADGLNGILPNWTQTLTNDYKAGEALSNQQATANTNLQTLAGQIQAKITADNNLTSAQSQADTAKVQADLSKAQAAVTAAVNADGVNAAETSWTQTLNSDYQAGAPLATQQATANANLVTLAGQVNAKILADTGLTSAQQQSAIANVNADLGKAQEAVNQATSADGVNTAVTTWTQTLNADYKTGQTLSAEQQAAISQLSLLATQVKKQIAGDTGLLTADQQSQSKQVDTDLGKALAAIQAAKDADDVNDTAAAWNQALTNDYQAGVPLATQQATATSQLNTLAGQIKTKITSDAGLTAVTQQAQSAQLANDLTQAQNAVNTATNADGVKSALSTWTGTLTGDYTAGVPLATQQSTQNEQLATLAAQTKVQIEDDSGLTGAQKAQQSSQVDQALAQGQATVSATKDADDMNSAAANWKQAISGEYHAGEALSSQQSTANSGLATTAGQVKNQILADNGLTSAQQQAEVANVNADLARAQGVVNGTTNADGVNSAVATWKPILQADYQAGESLTNQQANTYATLVNLAGQIKNRIKADTGLTSAAQSSQSNKVDSDLNQAQTAINATTNADDLNNTVSTWTGTLNAEYKAGEALSDQQESANNQLAVLANQVKVQIEADTGLTNAEQQSQSKQVDTDLASAQTAVSSATNADGVNSAVTTWTGTLNADHKVGQALSTQQATTNSNLATLADQIKIKINADTGLTGDAQQAEVATVNADLGKAQAAVSGATNADGVNSANNYWTQTLNGDYQAGQALSDQQATANANLGTLAGQVIAKIKADTGLTSAQQTAQVAQVNTDLTSAQGAVKSATKADGVNSAVATWTKTLNADYQAGETLTGEQSDAKTKLSLLADQVKTAILADTSLTGAAQQTQSSQVDTDLTQALQAVGSAQDADDVNNAVTTWTQTLNGEHKAGQALSTQASTAVNNLTTLAGQVKATILADTGLTAADQQAQTKQVAADLTKATAAVNAATNADGVNNAVSTWTPTLNGDYQAGQALADQQKSATNSLATLAGQVQNKIQADTGLTSADQQSQSNQVANDLSKAQAAVNSATNADGVNSALASWAQSLNGDYHAGQALSTQQATANANLAILAGQVKNQIASDTGLTAAKQQSLSSQVDTDLAKAQSAVNAATNADGVNSAATSWTKTLTADYQAGTALADQQAIAKSNLAGVAQQVTNKIKDDTGLTGAQQQSESNAVTADLAKADSDITNATNADGVNNAVATWTQTLNGDYQAGQALATQQTSASANLKALAGQVQAKITADNGLTAADQQAQSAQLATDLATAQGAVQSATNADGVNAAVATWTQTLNNDYKVGQALALQQAAANSNLATIAGQVKNKIQADTGLTGAQQQAEINQLNTDLGKAQSAVNAGTNADDVNGAVTTWTKTLNGDYTAGETLATQQDAANTNLAGVASQVINQIKNDGGLTVAQQTSESNNVNADLAKAQSAVKSATNADGVNGAVATWTQTLNADHQTGTTLSDEQQAANSQLAILAGQVKNKILADTGLTSATQQSQSKQVDADLTKALAAVGQAKDDDDVTQAVATWTGTLNADYQAGQTLSAQQTTAKNALSTLAGQVKAKITADTGLTQAQQQAQSGQVDADLAKAQAAVSGATDADDVNNTVNIWTPTLNGDYQAGQALSTQQASANQNLAALAGQVKAKINGDTGLTQAQQQTQAALVDKDLGKAQAVVTAATNADGVNSAVSTWTQTLNGDYTAGPALSTQQTTANTNLQVLAAQVKTQIATDTGLTGAQQKSATANVANDLTQAQSAVSAATNADGVNSAVSTWTEKLHNDYQAGEALATQQQTAQTNFSTLAGQVKAKITADTGLTNAQKQAEEANLTADLGKAQAVVAAATNADGVNNAVSTWTQTLNGDYQAGQALTDQQKAASQQLSVLAGQVTAQIKADTGLTGAAQQTDEANVAADLAKGQGAVSAAADADGVNSAVATWTQTLNNDYQAGEALKDQQATANSNLAALAGQVNAKILADTGLTGVSQQSQSNQLSADLTKAQGAVSAATNADGVNGAVATWTQTLNNDYTAGEPLKNQQDTATGNLATLADQVKAKITADSGLTGAAQQAQSSQVGNDLTKAQAAVTAATNADGVNNAVSTWTQTLNSDYQAGEALSNQQNTASGNLAVLAGQVKAKISADTGLTAAAQQAQSDKVTTDLTKAQSAVTTATNADGVNSAVASWTQALNNDYTAGEALSAQQLTANGNLGKVASQVKATISADTGLTSAAQQAQFAQVDADLAKAQAAVTAATNADGVNSAVATWTGTLNGDYKAGEALSTQQTTANGQLAAVANQVKAAISADTGLTGDQQQAEIANLNADLTKAQSAVSATTNADGVNSAAATWIATLNNDHKAGQVLSAEQMAANTNLAVLAGQVKNQILADTGLTDATQRDQSAQVDADLAKAQAAVSAATNDDGVNSAVSTWTPTLSGDYKAGQALSDQQTAATTALSTLADQTKAKITADTGLTGVAQQAQENQLANDLSNAKTAINGTTNADGVNSAVATWKQTLTNDYQAGEPLSTQQSNATASLSTLAGQVKAKILADTGLTGSAQQAQSAQLATDLTKAQSAVNSATNADGVNSTIASWTQTFNNDYTAGEPLSAQQSAKNNDLATLAGQVKAKIFADTGLTGAAQQAQSNQVTLDLAKAQAAVSGATNADGVNSAVSTWTQTLNADYQAGEPLTTQQATAVGQLGTLASQLKTKILADTGLTSAAQQSQSNQIDQDLAKAQSVVNAATSADGVNSAVSTWTQTLNADYKVGEALTAQQSTANSNLSTLADQVKAKIQADTGLTGATQQAQSAQVAQDLAKAQAAVSATANADGVNDAVSTWTQKLNSDYQAGQALATQQSSANSNLATLANQVKGKIQADTGLTGATQQSQSAQVGNDLAKAQAAVSAATNADGVNSAVSTWTQTLNHDYQAGQALSAQQLTANTNLATLADQVKDKISADTGLTGAAQQTQSNQVETDLAKAQAAVTAATNADGVNSAVSTWTQTLNTDYQAGQALLAQQSAANTNLVTLAGQVKAKILADTGLTSAAQQAQSNQVDADLAKAQAAVNGATTADGVNSAVSTWTQTLKHDYQAGQALSDQQSAANTNLATLAGQVKAKIQADAGLTSAAQQSQSNQVDQDLAKAQAAVTAATNADGVNSAVSTWTQTVTGDYKAGQALSAQQSAANTNLATLAGQVKAKIQADTGLTAVAQQSQSNQVDRDLAQAQTAVKNADNADGVNSAVATWTQTLNGDYQAGQALADQQKAANQQLTTLAGQITNQIDGDTGLTGANQQSESANVNADLAKAQTAVSGATNADGVNSAVSTWTQTLKADYKAGETLTAEQKDANSQLSILAIQVKNQILSDSGLTSNQQQSQSNQVDTDLGNALTAVRASKDDDDVNGVVTSWTKTLNGDYTAGEALTAQQATASGNLATLADQVKTKIQADTGLTNAQQVAQSGQVDTDLTQAKAAVTAATNADGLNSVVSTWTQTINGDYKAGEALSAQESTASDNLATLAGQVKAKIQADTGLTAAAQQAQVNQIGTDLTQAQAAVTAAKNADGLNSVVASWTQTLTDDYKAGEALLTQQSAANTSLATLAGQIKGKIQADTGLTTADQQSQASQLDQDLAKAQAAVNAATNADGVNSTTATWTQTLNGDYKAGQALAAQQSAANTNLATLAGQVKAKVMADTGLTSAQQTNQSSQVASDLTKAQAAVNAATNADGVNGTVATWTQTLNNDYQAGQALSTQQSNASDSLATLAGQVKAKVEGDTGLTAAAQQAQSGQIEADLAKAQAAVEAATNADGVNGAVSTWTQTLNGDYKAGQALAAQQLTASGSLTTLAGQVKAKVAADTGLTSAAQQAQSSQVDGDLTKAQAAIDTATNADGVNTAVATWTKTLNGDYQAGESLADQQSAATGSLATLAGQIKAKIEADTGLTGAAQQAQSAQVDQDLTKAQAAVNAATNADGVNSAVSTWTKTLNGDYQAGEALADQQSAANTNLATLAGQVKAKITADTGLTGATQQDQSAQVGNDLTKAQAAVNAATNADGVNSAVSTWTKTLNSDYQAGEALSSQQATAGNNLATLASQVKTKITADTGLTGATQQAQSNQLAIDLAKAQAAVNAASNADNVNSAVSTWTKTLNADYQAGEALSSQQATATNNLATLAGQVKAKIEADTGLTGTQQQAESGQVDQDLAKAQSAVNAATNADGVNAVVATWTQTINGDYRVGEALSDEQKDAGTKLSALAVQIKNQILSDTGLTSAAQKAQANQVDTDLGNALTAVSATKDDDDVNSAVATWGQTLNGDYKAGEALSAQQSTAANNLATLAGQVKAKIVADTGLTVAAQQAQEDQVARDLSQAQNGINGATNADGVNSIAAIWTQTLNGDYKAGEALSSQQATATNNLATLAGQVKGKIETDTGLTGAVQQAQSNQVATDLGKAQAAVNAASNADGVNSAVTSWIQTLNADYRAGETLSAQQLTANSGLVTLAGQMKAKIAVDAGLTGVAQQNQTNQVDQDLTKAQAAVNAATNADDVNNAVTTWTQTLNADYQAGEVLSTQQATAGNTLATLAGQVKAKITADTGLTGTQQQTESNQVDADLAKAQSAINAATNADGVNAAVSTWTQTLNGDYRAGEALSDEQKDAGTKLSTLALQIKNEILSDTGLTSAQQQAQSNQIDSDLSKALTAVGTAKDDDDVNSALATWTQTLNGDYKVGEALSTQQSTASASLTTLAGQVKAKITADTGLTGVAQQTQSAQVENDLTKAQAAVRSATNADGVNSAESAWTQTLNADYQAGEALSAQQSAATAFLATLADQVKAKITADTGLTGAAQQAQVNQVENDLTKAQAAVNAATNADGVNTVVSTWTQTLNADYRVGQALSTQQTAAGNTLATLAGQVKVKIAADTGLTSAAQSTQSNQVEIDLAKAQAAVNAATNADGVNSTVSAWTQTLNGDYQAGEALSAQQSTATKNLATLAGQVKAKIQADNGLTGTQQQTESGQVDQDLAKAQSAVNGATTADGVNTVVATWTQTINSDYRAGEALSDEQKDAGTKLSTLAVQIKNKILSDTGLTVAAQKAQSNQVDTDLGNALTAVSATKDDDDVNNVVATWTQTLNGDYKVGEALSAQQSAATGSLATLASQVKAKIATDTGLTAAAQQAQSAQVENDLTKAQAALTAATNADGVNSAVTAWTQTLNSDYQAGEALSTQQSAATNNLSTLASQVKAKIAADTGLTGAAQQAQSNQVETDLGKAQAAVNAATNADGVNSAATAWIQTLTSDYQVGQALSAQQLTANSSLAALAGQVKAQIKSDTGLTSVAQATQVSQVDTDLVQAQAVISAATNADGVNSAVSTWTKTLKADYQAGTALSTQQTNAGNNLVTLAGQVKAKIVADTGLTAVTQQTQSNQVEDDLTKAQAAVNATTNADGVNSVVAAWTQTLNADYRAGETLATQQSTANGSLAILAGQVKAAIKADTGLTGVAQQAQSNQVDADLAKAQAAVTATSNADGVNSAVATWTQTLNGDYQAGEALSNQQKTAGGNLATLADQVKAKITADTGLTSAAQQAESSQVETDLAKAQASVNATTNADGVNSAVSTWTQTLNGDYRAGEALVNQQQTANNALSTLANQVQAKIQADTGLTSAEQQTQSSQVASDLAKAQSAVGLTTNADGVNHAVASWTETLDGDYKTGKTLSAQQLTANSNLATLAGQVKAKIAADTGLTGASRQAQSNQVETDLAQAQGAVTAATNADGVNSAVSTWTQTLNADYKAGEALATQQATANTNLTTLANQVKGKIQADTGLTSASQQSEVDQVNADLAKAQDAVNATTNADGVNSAVSTWTQSLNADYQAGEALTAEQKDANTKLSALSVQVKSEILADTGLTSATQQTQLNQVDHDLGQALAAIGSSKDDDEVNTVVSAWTQTLNGDYKAGEVLPNQQATATAALTTLAGQVKAKILADTGLTSVDQQSQANQVAKDSTQAQAAVTAATNADGVNSAVTIWTATLNGDYKAGEALATQQASANGQLLTLAGQMKAKILADTGLTTVQQQNQSNQVDRDLTQAQAAVTAATNADGVNSAVATWTKTLNGDYQAGEALAVQQTIANANLATLSNQVKVKIEADAGLTSDQKQAQSKRVDADLDRAQSAVNATTNADGVDNEVSTWTKTLNADYQAGEPLPTQQSTANGQMTTLANQVKAKVETDTGLTSAEQQNQSAQVDRDLAQSQGAINTTTNADGVKNAIATWTQILSADYQAGEALSAQQSTANSNLATLASQVQAKIAADTGLTTAEQRVQSGQVNADLAQAQGVVNAAQNADAVNGAVATWIKTLNDDYKPGEVLSAQQSTATSNLEILAYQMKAKIAADTGLTGVEQHTQSAQVDTDLAKAEAVVSEATNADGLKNAIAVWTPTLTGDYHAGEALSAQQESAKSNLATLADQEAAKVAADTGLTSAEQQVQSGQVEADLAKAQAAVTAATNADGVNSAVATWTQTLTGDYHAGQALSTQQATANSNLNGLAGQVRAKILADTGLTSTAQQAQVTQVNQDLAKAQNTVSAATNADGVNSAVATWTQTLTGDYKAGQALSNQQVTATNQLADLANQVKAKIAGDAGLTSADHQAQSAQVENDLTKAEAAVTATTNADGLDNAVNTWTKTLNGDYKAGQAVAAQQATANDNLAVLASQVQAKIAADTGLTNAEKQAQSSHVEADLTKAETAVNAATNADGINSAATIWQQTLNHDYQEGAPLSSEQTAANTSLATLAGQVKAKILADTGLTTAQRQTQENQVDLDLAKAQSAVNQAKDDDGVNNAVTTGTQALNADYQAGKALAQQQQDADANLAAVANQVKAKIATDTGWTSVEKQSQSGQVDTDLSKANSAVNAATNADSVNSAVSTWTQTLNGDYHAGVSLDSQKAAAGQAFTTAATSARAAIEADKTLTTAQKQAQEIQVDQDQAKAQAAINAATDADETNAASAAGTQTMANDHQPGASIADQKAAANQAVAANATAAKAAIEADKTLTTAQKQAQESQVDQDQAKAQAAINAATDADETNAASAAGTQAMTNDHQPGASVADQKSSASQAVATNAAAAKSAIEADKTLTTAQKQAQESQVDQDAAKAQAAINAATDADETNAARNAGTQAMTNDHQPAASIADQKAAANQAVATNAAAAKAVIEADKTLTTAQKQAQDQQIDQDEAKAQAAINAATDADETNAARDAGNQAVVNDHQPGASIADQKAAANQAVANKAATIKAAIEADKSLTTAQKQAEENQVDQAVTKAKAAINAATDADAMNAARDAGNQVVVNDHQPGTSIADQRAAADQAVAAKAAATKAAIEADNSLTTAQKQAEENQVDQALAKAQAAINAATNADGIQTNLATYNQQLQKLQDSLTELTGQESAQPKQSVAEKSAGVATQSVMTVQQDDRETERVTISPQLQVVLPLTGKMDLNSSKTKNHAQPTTRVTLFAYPKFGFHQNNQSIIKGVIFGLLSISSLLAMTKTYFALDFHRKFIAGKRRKR